jgi:L-threonylcarbamoyladenylate synthase
MEEGQGIKSHRPFRSENLNDALKTWDSGGLVAIPTETVIGLGAPVNNEELIKKVFSYKERPFFDPLIVHVSSVEQAINYVKNAHWNEIVQKLVETFWPGPLTLVLEKSEKVSDLITSGLNTVGIRMPASVKTRELIEKLGHGVAAPSANKFTKTSPTLPEHVERAFENDFLCVLIDENSEKMQGKVGIESTIIQVENDTLRMLRPGAITPYDIDQALVGLSYQWRPGKTAFDQESEKVLAPGELPVHYRPDYPLWLCEEGAQDSFFIWAKREGLREVEAEVFSLDQDPFVTARQLYFQIQKPLQEQKLYKLFLLPQGRSNKQDRHGQMWASVMNRLEKAGRLFDESALKIDKK